MIPYTTECSRLQKLGKVGRRVWVGLCWFSFAFFGLGDLRMIVFQLSWQDTRMSYMASILWFIRTYTRIIGLVGAPCLGDPSLNPIEACWRLIGPIKGSQEGAPQKNRPSESGKWSILEEHPRAFEGHESVI